MYQLAVDGGGYGGYGDALAAAGGGYAGNAGVFAGRGPGGSAQAPAQAASDPFAYTGGSLLTPWTQAFTPPPGSGGGYSAPAYQPFNFAAFNPGANYNPGSVSTERIAGPEKQAFTAYQGQSPYQAGTVSGPAAYAGANVAGQTIAGPSGPLTADKFSGPSFAEAQNDPGYQFALKQGQGSLSNKFAASGLRGAGQAQAFADYNQGKAAEQYQNVWNRAFQGTQANNASAAQAYGLTNQYQQGAQMFNASQRQQAELANQQTGFNAWDRQAGYSQQAALANEANRMQAHGMNESNALNAYNSNFNASNTVHQNNFQNAFNVAQANNQNNISAYSANTTAGLGAANLNYNMASGAYDRNYSAARTNYEDQRSAANAAASAGASNSNQEYNRALQQYQMQYGIFKDNQDTQFSRLMAMSNLGNPGQVSPMQYAGAQGDIYTNRGNAQAAGQVGSGNAWQQAFGNIGQAGLGAAGAYAGYMGGYQ